MNRARILAAVLALVGLAALAAPDRPGVAAVRLAAANPSPVLPPGPPPRLHAGTLLVAARDLADPNFRHTVVLLLAYGATGALGVVLNRPASLALADVLRKHVAPGDAAWAARVKVHLGGPVEPGRVLLLARADNVPPDAQEVVPSVYTSASVRTLDWAAAHLGAEAVRVYVGYAGWAPEQLEHEVDAGGWHIAAATAELVFAPPAQLWPKLIRDVSGTWVRRGGSSLRGNVGQIATQDVLPSPGVR